MKSLYFDPETRGRCYVLDTIGAIIASTAASQVAGGIAGSTLGPEAGQIIGDVAGLAAGGTGDLVGGIGAAGGAAGSAVGDVIGGAGSDIGAGIGTAAGTAATDLSGATLPFASEQAAIDAIPSVQNFENVANPVFGQPATQGLSDLLASGNLPPGNVVGAGFAGDTAAVNAAGTGADPFAAALSAEQGFTGPTDPAGGVTGGPPAQPIGGAPGTDVTGALPAPEVVPPGASVFDIGGGGSGISALPPGATPVGALPQPEVVPQTGATIPALSPSTSPSPMLATGTPTAGPAGGSLNLSDVAAPTNTSFSGAGANVGSPGSAAIGTGADTGNLLPTAAMGTGGNASAINAAINPSTTTLGNDFVAQNVDFTAPTTDTPSTINAAMNPGNPSGGSSFGDHLLGQVKNNALGLGLTGAGLLGSVLMQPKMPDTAALTRQLQTASAPEQAAGQSLLTTGENVISQGQGLVKPLAEGAGPNSLPVGATTEIDNAVNAAKAQVRSQYANMDLSGSTMEAQALAQIDANAVTQRVAIAQQLAQTGLQEIGAGGQTASTGGQLIGGANQVTEQLLSQAIASDEALSQAVSNFAGAAGAATNPTNALLLSNLLARNENEAKIAA